MFYATRQEQNIVHLRSHQVTLFCSKTNFSPAKSLKLFGVHGSDSRFKGDFLLYLLERNVVIEKPANHFVAVLTTVKT